MMVFERPHLGTFDAVGRSTPTLNYIPTGLLVGGLPVIIAGRRGGQRISRVRIGGVRVGVGLIILRHGRGGGEQKGKRGSER